MRLTQEEIAAIAGMGKDRGLELAALMATIEVESGGQTYVSIDGRMEPLIRWEGHYFDRLVPPAKQAIARRAGLANPKAGGVKNPKSQVQRYAMLRRAMAIDRDAAIMSCSWGVGQVMGSHWQWLGYKSAWHFYTEVSASVIGQVEVMLRYIEKAGLTDELQRQDWAAFARGYNGPKYAKYGYHTKLRAAYRRQNASDPRTPPTSGMLRLGSNGKGVREVQSLLSRAGWSLKIDGDFGPRTKQAVMEFQRANGTSIDGVVGPETMRLLSRYRNTSTEDAGATSVSENPDVKGGAASTGAGGLAAVTADKLSDLADKVGPTGVNWIDYAVAGLYIVSGCLVVGGVAWAAWGHLKSNKTYFGVA